MKVKGAREVVVKAAMIAKDGQRENLSIPFYAYYSMAKCFLLYMTATRIDKVLSYNCCCLSSKTSKERKYRNVAATSETARRE